MSAAANAMRNILVEQARRKARLRHGGGQRRLDVAGLGLAIEPPGEDVLAVDHAVARLEGPAVFGHAPVHHRQADHFFQTFQVPEDQCTVGPWAGHRYVQVVTPWFGFETAAAAGSGAAVRGDPVAELCRAAYEVALVGLGVVPAVLPFSTYQQTHGLSPVCRFRTGCVENHRTPA